MDTNLSRASTALAFIFSALVTAARPGVRSSAADLGGFHVKEDAEEIRISSPEIEAAIRKTGYVSGVKGGSFLDKKTGARDLGFGLDIVDWIMEPGSDAAYRDKLEGDLAYHYGNAYHGNIPKRSVEGPQICTQAKELSPHVIRGKGFVAVRQTWKYRIAAPGKKPGSVWEQTLVFPEGKRWFFACDRVSAVNESDAMFLRIDMPGHLRHEKGDSFGEIYLSYYGRIPSSEFIRDFPPDEKFLYRRETFGIPPRFIRAYRVRDPGTGRDGPWLAGMTLDPKSVWEAWCHQRGYVCFIQEFGGRPIRPGESFSAAFIVGWFDSIEEMHEVYDRFAGARRVVAEEDGWRLASEPENAADLLADRLEWFQDLKFGLFTHFGAYSQWGCIESWPLVEEDAWARPDDLAAWVERGRDLKRFRRDYWELPRTFRPEKLDPTRWAAAARAAGMRYFVFTTKHHDGFCMFDTRLTDYRITHPDCPFSRDPRSDVARVLFDAFREQGLGIGVYFSKADWHHPDYWSPEAPARTRNPNYDTLAHPEKWDRFVRFVHGQIEELMTRYGRIDILWLDAGQVRPPRQDIRMGELVAMARRHQPHLIVVDRTVGGPHENYLTPEQEVPPKPLPQVWESCVTLGTQWSYRPGDAYKSPREIIHLLVDVVAKGGNLLLNIGPQPDGELPPPALERLEEIGRWMAVNAEAIHGTRPMAPYKVGNVALTRRRDVVYAIELPDEGIDAPPARLALPAIRPRPGSAVRLLGFPEPIPWKLEEALLVLEIPESARREPPCRYAFAFRIELAPP